MTTKTVNPRWLLAEGLKIALILLIGFAFGRVGVDLLTAFPVFPPVIWELFSEVIRASTIITAALYAVIQATLRAHALTNA